MLTFFSVERTLNCTAQLITDLNYCTVPIRTSTAISFCTNRYKLGPVRQTTHL